MRYIGSKRRIAKYMRFYIKVNSLSNIFICLLLMYKAKNWRRK